MLPRSVDTAESIANSDSSADETEIDSGLELLDEASECQSDASEEQTWWYATTGSSTPVGPVTSRDIQERLATGDIDRSALVWCQTMQGWAPAVDVFGVPALASSRSGCCLPPPLTNAPVKASTSTSWSVRGFCESVGNWRPSDTLLHCVARITMLLGMLLILLLPIFAMFGILWFSRDVQIVLVLSGAFWFSGAVQVILVGSVLELATVVRTFLPVEVAIRNSAMTLHSVQDQTHDQNPSREITNGQPYR